MEGFNIGDESLGLLVATGYDQENYEVTTWFPYRYADWLKQEYLVKEQTLNSEDWLFINKKEETL